jgi:hypothetical protein
MGRLSLARERREVRVDAAQPGSGSYKPLTLILPLQPRGEATIEVTTTEDHVIGLARP